VSKISSQMDYMCIGGPAHRKSGPTEGAVYLFPVEDTATGEVVKHKYNLMRFFGTDVHVWLHAGIDRDSKGAAK
jgi:hypothetical protein